MSLESEIENQLFAVRRVVLASGWRQGLTSLFKVMRRAAAFRVRCSLQVVAEVDLHRKHYNSPISTVQVPEQRVVLQ